MEENIAFDRSASSANTTECYVEETQVQSYKRRQRRTVDLLRSRINGILQEFLHATRQVRDDRTRHHGGNRLGRQRLNTLSIVVARCHDEKWLVARNGETSEQCRHRFPKPRVPMENGISATAAYKKRFSLQCGLRCRRLLRRRMRCEPISRALSL